MKNSIKIKKHSNFVLSVYDCHIVVGFMCAVAQNMVLLTASIQTSQLEEGCEIKWGVKKNELRTRKSHFCDADLLSCTLSRPKTRYW